MSDDQTIQQETPSLHLLIRKKIKATPERLFEAWTRPEQLMKWWGPKGVVCSEAEVELRVGGRYRIANQMPDGSVIWISGQFMQIIPPEKLVYTWGSGEEVKEESQLVTVRFERLNGETEVIVLHERIPNKESQAMHEHGWLGCLDGLVEYLQEE